MFHYDSVGNTIEEELFIPSDKSVYRSIFPAENLVHGTFIIQEVHPPYRLVEADAVIFFHIVGPEGISDRENNPQHEIKIMKIDETGSMDFVVHPVLVYRSIFPAENLVHGTFIIQEVHPPYFLPSGRGYPVPD